VDEWKEQKTNQLPRLVMITLRLADNPHSSQVTEEITRIINLPAKTVLPMWQMPRGGGNNPPQPGQQLPPGQQPPPNQQFPPVQQVPPMR
jgi:hypothetical protein